MKPLKTFNNVILGQFVLTGIPIKVYVDGVYYTITSPDDLEDPIYGFGMDEDGQFTYTKPEPKEEQPAEGGDMVENDPLAGSNLDQRDLDEQARQFAQGGGKPQENPPATRNKPSMSVGPDKRLQGLPQDAGNQNVDRRSERRVG